MLQLHKRNQSKDVFLLILDVALLEASLALAHRCHFVQRFRLLGTRPSYPKTTYNLQGIKDNRHCMKWSHENHVCKSVLLIIFYVRALGHFKYAGSQGILPKTKWRWGDGSCTLQACPLLSHLLRLPRCIFFQQIMPQHDFF